MSRVKGSPQHRIVLRTHRPRRRLAWLSLALSGLILLCLLSYWSGESAGLNRLRTENVFSDVADMQTQIERLDREREVDQSAIEQSRQTIRDLEQEIAQLNQDINFYRSVMAPELKVDGLQVEKVRFDWLRQPGKFELNWLVTQPGQNNDYAEGQLGLELEGVQGQSDRVLTAEELKVVVAQLSYKFKYFQQFSLQLDLPEDFEPHLIRFSFPATKDKEPVQYEWVIDEQEKALNVEG